MIKNEACRRFIEHTRFKTINDSRLEKFFLNTLRWLYAVANRQTEKPRWFTVCGRSGTGKTMLLTELFNFCKDNFQTSVKLHGDNVSLYDFYAATTSQLADTFRQYGYNAYAEKADLLFVDDIGAEKDTTGFVKGKLCELLSRRLGKWTLLTSNLTLTEIGENYDNRISSRIIRDDNMFVRLYWMDSTKNEIKYVDDFAARKCF